MKTYIVTIETWTKDEGDGLLADCQPLEAESHEAAFKAAIAEFVTPYENIANVTTITIEPE